MSSRVGFVALDNLHPTNFRLDTPPVRVLSTANLKVFVDHGNPLGHATHPVADRDPQRRDRPHGFLTTNLLDGA